MATCVEAYVTPTCTSEGGIARLDLERAGIRFICMADLTP